MMTSLRSVLGRRPRGVLVGILAALPLAVLIPAPAQAATVTGQAGVTAPFNSGEKCTESSGFSNICINVFGTGLYVSQVQAEQYFFAMGTGCAYATLTDGQLHGVRDNGMREQLEQHLLSGSRFPGRLDDVHTVV